MSPVQPPPILNKQWNLNDLWTDLLNIGKDDAFREQEDSSYPYWEKWKYLADSWKYDPLKIWTLVKSYRRNKNRVNFSGSTFPLDISTPSIVQQLLHELDMNLGGSLQANELIPSEEKQRYLVSSLMEEAIASSQLEGAATTRKLAKEMLESNRKPRNHSEQMISNNYAAMQWIVRNKDTYLSEKRILEIHQIITHNTLPVKSEEGAFRTTDDIQVIDVQTGRLIHRPPEIRDLARLMNDFCEFANDGKRNNFFLHPISKAIILHFLIGYLHPFTDGNGRTARAIFYWYLIRKGYWLIEYMSVSRIILGSKAQYARAYQHTELDDNDLTYFILYNLKCITRALEELKNYIDRKNKEKKNILQLLRQTDYNDRQIDLLQEILNDKKNVFSVREVETRFAVSNQTARNDLNQLVARGILETRKSGNKIQFLVTRDGLKKNKIQKID
ncbi:MAG: Fic family protein [Bacteroidota bacterium]|nr:Fic family protein [Bacteroidota bacterium]